MGNKKTKVDWFLIGIILFLTGLSLLILFSDQKELFNNQLISVGIGFFLFLIFSFFPYQFFKKISLPLFIFSLFLLFLTLILGKTARGATRWLNFGPFSFQPSEVIKPLLVIILANQPDNLIPFSIFLPFAAIIFAQPDLGTTIAISFGAMGVFLKRPQTKKIFLILLFLTIVSFPLLWHFLAPFQKARLTSFLNPKDDPLGSNYQSLQAIISIGSGKIAGRGLGLGPQSRLAFLPEYHNDLIFASLVESLGFLGGIFILLAYLTLFLHLANIDSKISDPFGKLIVSGILFLLSGQTIVNIAMNMGLLPITGITLPLLSYGGSSYISTMISLGICHNIWRQSSFQPQELRIK